MTRIRALAILMTFTANTACQAADAPTGSIVATDPATPADHQTSADNSAKSWLDRIEKRASQIKTLHAKITYDRIQQLVGDRQRRFGRLVYAAGPPGRFAVLFDRLLVDNRLDHDERQYIFDGQWLVERYDDEKLFIKRQIAPPPRPGHPAQGADPLALGSGPFALPINMQKDKVLQRFHVELIRPCTLSDQPDAIQLRLTPKATDSNGFTRMDLVYNRRSLLPLVVSTLDDSENQSVITLSELRVNTPIDDGVLDTTAPTERGWRVEVKPWEDRPASTGSQE